MLRTILALAVAGTWLIFAVPRGVLAGPGGQLTLEVIDHKTKQPLACRMHLTNAAGKPLKAPRVPFWHDHFVFDGTITLKLPKGEYDFVIERGLEYLTRGGHFKIEDLSKDTKVVDLERFADLAAEGWWSGDVDAARPAVDLELLMRADDLHVVELVSWPNRKPLLAKLPAGHEALVRFDNDRWIHRAAGIDNRAGGTLLYFNLPRPLELGGVKADVSARLELLERVRQAQGWVDAQTAYGWDVPVWVALGQVDSIQVQNSNLRRATVQDDERGGKPRDTLLFPAPHGNGRWSEKIYYHLLNCGLRIPPTAGSGSGEVPNPLGYNRMYVHVDGEMSYDAWRQAVRAGRVVITNGPLIRPTVEGQMPGHVFRAEAGQEMELEVGMTLSTRDRISYLEVIQDGQLVHQARLEEFAKRAGRLPPVVFRQSGWLLLRAVAEVEGTYRYAMTAPYYVEIGEAPRISKQSARFFLDWVNERAGKTDQSEPFEQAREFWQSLVERANAP